nr:hypothetical protein [Luteibacter rhizovicinus]
MVVADADYSCVLRIDGSVLDFDAIDSALGVRGERRHVTWRATRWRPAVDLQRWEFPEPEDGSCRTWSSLEDALRFTVERMLPARERLGSYVESDQVYWWIGCFHRAPSSTIYMPHDLVEQLKDLGVPVILSNYFRVSEEEETDEDRARVIEEVDEGGPNHTYRFWIGVAGGPREKYLSRNDGWTPLGEATDFSVAEYSLDFSGVRLPVGERIVGFDMTATSSYVSNMRTIPNGWDIDVITNLRGLLMSAGAFLSALPLSTWLR